MRRWPSFSCLCSSSSLLSARSIKAEKGGVQVYLYLILVQDYAHERGVKAGGWVLQYSQVKKFKLTRGCCQWQLALATCHPGTSKGCSEPLIKLSILPPQWQVSFKFRPNNPMAPPECEGWGGASPAPGNHWYSPNEGLWTQSSASSSDFLRVLEFFEYS